MEGCKSNRPTNNNGCKVGDPGKGLKCYCYVPASTVGTCWAATEYGG